MKLILSGKFTLACLSIVLLAASCRKDSSSLNQKPKSVAEAQASAAAAATYQLVWSDEFNGTSVNTGNWNFETGAGGWGNNEQQYYRSQNASVSNGNLVITARRESYGGANYTSARMTTQNKRTFTYGRMEARIRLPLGQGLWPAFWMLGSNISSVGWPRCGEIDIMEHVNTATNVHGTIHWDANGYAQYGGNVNTTPSNYHVYSVEWNNSAIKWFVDGVKYHEANILNNINSTEEFHRPFFFILNLAVGGNWPGQTIDNSKLPASMYVDYVRVYQLR
jgi:beta-glucanase (GH16 family)